MATARPMPLPAPVTTAMRGEVDMRRASYQPVVEGPRGTETG